MPYTEPLFRTLVDLIRSVRSRQDIQDLLRDFASVPRTDSRLFELVRGMFSDQYGTEALIRSNEQVVPLLIRFLQFIEHNPTCFRNEDAIGCNRVDCIWMQECLGEIGDKLQYQCIDFLNSIINEVKQHPETCLHPYYITYWEAYFPKTPKQIDCIYLSLRDISLPRADMKKGIGFYRFHSRFELPTYPFNLKFYPYLCPSTEFNNVVDLENVIQSRSAATQGSYTDYFSFLHNENYTHLLPIHIYDRLIYLGLVLIPLRNFSGCCIDQQVAERLNRKAKEFYKYHKLINLSDEVRWWNFIHTETPASLQVEDQLFEGKQAFLNRMLMSIEAHNNRIQNITYFEKRDGDLVLNSSTHGCDREGKTTDHFVYEALTHKHSKTLQALQMGEPVLHFDENAAMKGETFEKRWVEPRIKIQSNDHRVSTLMFVPVSFRGEKLGLLRMIDGPGDIVDIEDKDMVVYHTHCFSYLDLDKMRYLGGAFSSNLVTIDRIFRDRTTNLNLRVQKNLMDIYKHDYKTAINNYKFVSADLLRNPVKLQNTVFVKEYAQIHAAFWELFSKQYDLLFKRRAKRWSLYDMYSLLQSYYARIKFTIRGMDNLRLWSFDPKSSQEDEWRDWSRHEMILAVLTEVMLNAKLRIPEEATGEFGHIDVQIYPPSTHDVNLQIEIGNYFTDESQNVKDATGHGLTFAQQLSKETDSMLECGESPSPRKDFRHWQVNFATQVYPI